MNSRIRPNRWRLCKKLIFWYWNSWNVLTSSFSRLWIFFFPFWWNSIIYSENEAPMRGVRNVKMHSILSNDELFRWYFAFSMRNKSSCFDNWPHFNCAWSPQHACSHITRISLKISILQFHSQKYFPLTFSFTGGGKKETKKDVSRVVYNIQSNFR